MHKNYILCFLSLALIVCCNEYDGMNPLNVSANVDRSRSMITTMIREGGDNRRDTSIVNSWVHDTGDITLAFSESGIYSYIYDDGDCQYREYGTYSVSDNLLNAMDSDGYAFTETFEFDGSILTFHDEDGYSQSFSKI